MMKEHIIQSACYFLFKVTLKLYVLCLPKHQTECLMGLLWALSSNISCLPKLYIDIRLPSFLC